MDEKVIREEIRKVLRETLQQHHPVYPSNGSSNMFPYEKKDDIVRLPEEINTKEEYLLNWDEVSENNDLYGFPMQEFVKGIYVEKAKRSLFNILDLAEIVINNLRENHQFYTNLGV